jgi:hypothetical protein
VKPRAGFSVSATSTARCNGVTCKPAARCYRRVHDPAEFIVPMNRE